MQAVCWFVVHKNMMCKLENVFVALFLEVNVFNFIAWCSRQRRVGQPHDWFRCCTVQQCSLGRVQNLYTQTCQLLSLLHKRQAVVQFTTKLSRSSAVSIFSSLCTFTRCRYWTLICYLLCSTDVVQQHSRGVVTQYWFPAFFFPVFLMLVRFVPQSMGVTCEPLPLYCDGFMKPLRASEWVVS